MQNTSTGNTYLIIYAPISCIIYFKYNLFSPMIITLHIYIAPFHWMPLSDVEMRKYILRVWIFG